MFDVIVGDLIYNDDFDCNCNYEIYDCTEHNKCWNDGAELIFNTKVNGFQKPLNSILDMRIKYITINIAEMAIVIEATR